MEKFSFEEVSPPFLPSLGFRSTNNTHIIILNPAFILHPYFLSILCLRAVTCPTETQTFPLR